MHTKRPRASLLDSVSRLEIASSNPVSRTLWMIGEKGTFWPRTGTDEDMRITAAARRSASSDGSLSLRAIFASERVSTMGFHGHTFWGTRTKFPVFSLEGSGKLRGTIGVLSVSPERTLWRLLA